MPDAPGSAGLRLFHTRPALIALSTLLAVHLFAFVAFWPGGVTIADEGTYIRQAQLMLSGSTSIERPDPFTGEPVEFRPFNRYPLGTALAMLPFLALGGREAASLLSLLCTLAAVGLTARWLLDYGRSPLWAGLLLAYPPAIVFSRIAMSEAASLLVVTLALWLHERGQRRGAAWLFAAGLAGGASFAFREANVLVVAPFFLGSMLRRDPGGSALVAGGVLGVALRGASAWLFFGDPFFTKPPDVFGLVALASTLPLYLGSLMLGVPGGLVAVFAYRGARRPELIAGVVLFVVFHLFYSYSGEPSGGLKRLLLGPRYFIPLLPLLAVASAEAWPRLASRARARWPGARLERAAGAATIAAVVGIAVGGVGVQWAHGSWAREQAAVRATILEHTDAGAVVVTNWEATGKFFDLVEDDRVVVARQMLSPPRVKRLLAERGVFFVVLLDRSESEFWRRNAFDNERFVKGLPAKESVYDHALSPTDRLRVYRVGAGAASGLR